MQNNNKGLVVDNNNYYIYKDSWIENFNQNGWENIKGDFSCFDDLVDDVIHYMNQIQDEISNDNQNDDESHDIVTNKKEKLPMYIIGHSLGGGIALRILQLLGKGKEDNINAGEANNYKKCNIMLDNSTNINEVDKDMYDINNSNDYDFDNSCSSISSTTNTIASVSDKDQEYYNYLDKLNIKGCISLSGMMRFKTIWNARDDSIERFYLPVVNFISRVAPNLRIPSGFCYKGPQYVVNIFDYIFRINSGIKFKCISELIKAMITLNCNINYMPTDVPLLFVHSIDDNVCYYKGTVSFYNQANVSKKNLHIVEGMNHFTTTKPGNEDILKILLNGFLI
ncbi:hypothetical protein [Plasmodium yoelii yoelii]|uniref:Serine aminopeptidase S33 domain-containing protein n=2 Tax=Plasmodium yoelii TaxID=5861 RepID=Q7RIG5_PLAYO|nr:hypothetical protein [Plasmodium yoelii yoelii]